VIIAITFIHYNGVIDNAVYNAVQLSVTVLTNILC